jgi:hypothetical protein
MAPGADWEWMDQKLDREGMEAIARKHQPELETCISSVKKKKKKAGCWWLMPVILATREAEIRRMAI